MSSLLRALFNGTSKHKKLSENWATTREPVVDGVTFYCKYLGSTMVDDPKGESTTAEAIKRIIQIAKMTDLKPEKVCLEVSVEGIDVKYTESEASLLQTSIYKISYCSADAHYDHVFAFISTNDNDTCECHAFLCPKRKMAQAVTISIAQAFNLAYEYWKMAVENKNEEIFAQEELPAEVMVNPPITNSPIANSPGKSNSQPSSQASSPIPIRSDFGSSDMSTSGYQSSNQGLLINFDESSEQLPQKLQNDNEKVGNKPWDVFDDFDDINDGFSRLALRAKEECPPVGTCPSEWEDQGRVQCSAPLPITPIANISWLSASSPPLANSPPSPWEIGQSPPSISWEELSQSPNMAFLHSCQSPPSNSFANFSQFSSKFTVSDHQEAKPAEGTTNNNNNNPFIVKSTKNEGNAELPSSNPFSKSSLNSAQVNACGSSQQAWTGDVLEGSKNNNKLICS